MSRNNTVGGSNLYNPHLGHRCLVVVKGLIEFEIGLGSGGKYEISLGKNLYFAQNI